MDKPLQNNPLLELNNPEEILFNLSTQFFTGKNEEILKAFLAQFPYGSVDEFVQTVLPGIAQKFTPETFNFQQLEEEFNPFALAIQLGEAVDPDSIPIKTKEESESFDESVQGFIRTLLHDVAFPLLVMENPNMALSAKNMLKRMISGSQELDGVDISKIYEELGIENLPTEFSAELFFRLGGKIPGLNKEDFPSYQDRDYEEAEYVIDVDQPEEIKLILHCELSTPQAIYLGHVLEQEHEVIKNGKAFYKLLKGKKFENILVIHDKQRKKLGLLLTVLDILHHTKDLDNTKYLRCNRGNGGIWRFFEGYLIDTTTDKLYGVEFRKIIGDIRQEEKAKKIVEEVLDPKRQEAILKKVEEITKNKKS